MIVDLYENQYHSILDSKFIGQHFQDVVSYLAY